MIRRNKKLIIITSIITLLPVLAGVLLWNSLPDTIATHFGSGGVANGYSSKAVAVFGTTGILLACHLLCAFVTGLDPRRKNITDKIYRLLLWICPIMSVINNAMIYAIALGYTGFNAERIACVMMGILFLVIGNYLPKCRQNYTIGIKLPWTLDNEENWNRTHRMAGWLWIAGGVVMLISTFQQVMSQVVVILSLTMIMVLVPTVYSFIIYVKQLKEQ